MTLPNLIVPTFDIIIPVTNKKIKCRPFLVKEEKILLMALNTKNNIEILNAIKQIINNCIINNYGNNIDDLAIFELEYILLKIRMKSKGETITLKYNGLNDDEIECEECKKPKQIILDLNKITIKTFPEHNNKIQLTDSIGIIMGYPKVSNIQSDLNIEDDFELILNSIKMCVESIYDKENVYLKKDINEADLNLFIENLQNEQFNMLYNFILTLPRLEHEIDLSCKNCGREEKQLISGLQSFFL